MGEHRRRPTLSGASPSTFWRIREEIPTTLRIPLVAISLVLPLLLWILLDASGRFSEVFLPSPIETLAAARDMISSGDLANDTRASVQRVAIGFGIALAHLDSARARDGDVQEHLLACSSQPSASCGTCRRRPSSHC